MIVLDGGVASLGDLLSLEQLESSNLAAPTTYLELKVTSAYTLYAYCALFGPQHPLTVAQAEVVKDLMTYEEFYSEHMHNRPERPIQVLVHQSQRALNYIEAYNHTRDFRDIPCPLLRDPLVAIRNRCFVPPDMPDGFSSSGSSGGDTVATDLSSLTSPTAAATTVHVHIDGVTRTGRPSAGGGGGGGDGADDGTRTGRGMVSRKNNGAALDPPLMPMQRMVRVQKDGSMIECFHKFCQSHEKPLMTPVSVQECKELLEQISDPER